jgi:hypothetical protein
VLETEDINQSLQRLKAEISELEARLKDQGVRRKPNIPRISSVAKRMLSSAQRVEELVSAADRDR